MDGTGAPALGAMRVTVEGHLYRATYYSLQSQTCRLASDAQQYGFGGNGVLDPETSTYTEMSTSATSGRRLNYIFSGDGRVQVGSTTTYPWRTIGQINMQSSTGATYTCSGATVGARAVLTAGHCVHSGPGGAGWYNVQFSAGRSCNTAGATCKAPYGTLGWSHITTYQAWTNSKDWRWVGGGGGLGGIS